MVTERLVALVDRIILLNRVATLRTKILNVGANGRCRFFRIKGCSDSSDVDNDGDGTFYATCRIVLMTVIMPIFARVAGTSQNGILCRCSEEYDSAELSVKYENCYYDNVEQSWIPVVSGFC